MNVEAVYKITPDIATNIGVMFFSFVCPGFLLWYLISPELFIALDFLKLLVLAVAVSAPTFIVPYMLTFVCYLVMRKRNFDSVGLYGGPRSWYLRHGINNAMNMYAIVALSYWFGASGSRLLLFIFVVIVFSSVLEVFKAVRFVKDPDEPNSITLFGDSDR